jgi:hypothetical protein
MTKYYYRLCLGLTDYGTFFPEETFIYDQLKTLDRDIYTSVYLYTEEQVKEAETLIEVYNKSGDLNKRPRGVGSIQDSKDKIYDTMKDVFSRRLVFDFDSDDISLAQKDTKTLIQRLLSKGIDESAIQLYFSGRKGYGIVVDTNDKFNPDQLKDICLGLAENLTTLDTRIYNPSRIFRLPLSKHQVSNLYKTPLMLDEIDIDPKTVAQFKTLPDQMKNAYSISNISDEIKSMKLTSDKVVEREIKIVGNSLQDLKELILAQDFTKKIPNMPVSKWLLNQGLIPRGFGQEARMILASTYRAMNIDETTAYHMLKAVSEKRVALFGKDAGFDKTELYTNVIASVYSPQWKGGQYSITEHPLLKSIEELLPDFLKSKKQESNIITMDDAFMRFSVYAKDVDKNTIKLGIPSFDENLRIMTKNVYGLVASPSAGKTSWLLQVLENTSAAGTPSIYFSFDMSSDDTLLKIITRHTGDSEQLIANNFRDNNLDRIKLYEKIVKEKYANVEFVFKQLTVDEMISTIQEREKATNREFKLVGIDYLTKIKTLQTEITNKTEEAISGCHYLAKEFNKAVIVLLQPNKANSHPDKPLSDYNGIKGAATISEVCTAIITIHREGFNPRSFADDKFLTMICVKNRKGRLFSLDFQWDGPTGLITEMDQKAYVKLAALRERIADEAEEARDERRGSW